MNNNKGQTLVEFVLVMPVFLLLIISLIDIGNIMIKKMSLEDNLQTVYDMYEDEKYTKIDSYVKEKDIIISYNTKDNLTNIKLSKSINVISPILRLITGKTYVVEVNRDYYKSIKG